MFWPSKLPFIITFWSLAGLVLAVTLLAPLCKRGRRNVLGMAMSVAFFAFIPSCIGVQYVVDGIRFGVFEYANVSEIKDFRAKRYMPTSATNIVVLKYASGYQAKYNISPEEFHIYLDEIWDKDGSISSQKRVSGEVLSPLEVREVMDIRFADLPWPALNNPSLFKSPRESDGGGADYYFDADSGVVYQDTAHW